MSNLTERDGLSKLQISNLNKLADYLDSLPAGYGKFDMLMFSSKKGLFSGDRAQRAANAYASVMDCGSVACAVGHGPDAGIKPKRKEDWINYSERVFMPQRYCGAWYWCFGGGWEDTDNTPRGAAARIRYFLEKGVPDEWQFQMTGKAPLCYEVAA